MDDDLSKAVKFIASSIFEYCEEVKLHLDKLRTAEADVGATINRLHVINLEVSTGAAIINHYLDNTA